MAYLNICGFETGDASELSSTNGTYSIQSTTKRTGTYAARVNPTASNAYVAFKGLASNGTPALSTNNLYCSFYFRIATLPGSTGEICGFSGPSNKFRIRITSAGALQVAYLNTTPAWVQIGSDSATLSTNTWYLIEFKATSINTSTPTLEGKIDGSVFATGTASNFSAPASADEVFFGTGVTGGLTLDFYYDDIAISDSAYPGAGQVRRLTPNATESTYTDWTGTYTDVDDAPHDSDTTFINNAGATKHETYPITGYADVTGSIGCLKFYNIARKNGAGDGHTQGIYVEEDGSSLQSWSGVDPGTSYVMLAGIKALTNGAAWTVADLDGLKVGASNDALNTADIRVTALGAMVWCTGQINTTVTPAAASLTLTAYTPSVVLGTKLTPGALSLTTTRYTPTVLTPVVATPGALALTMTPYTPSVTIGLTVTPGALALALTAYPPTVINPQSATPGAASLTLTGYAPSALTPVVAIPGAGAMALTAYALSPITSNIVTPGAASMALTGYVPVVQVGWQLTPGPASLVLATYGITWTLSGFKNPARSLYGVGRFAAPGRGSGRFDSIKKGTGRI